MGHAQKILFVDDEETIRLTLAPVLQSYGFNVTCAATVSEALGLIAQQSFDVLISDLNIGHPGDGFTVISAMRSAQPDAVRFVLTGYPAFESALEAIHEEVDDYLIKPTETEMLVEKIRSKLAKRSPAPGILRKRLTYVIRDNRESIIEHWLQAAKRDPEIAAIPITDPARKNGVSLLLDVVTDIVEGREVTAEDRKSYARHGARRHKQGYTVPLLVRETRLLQSSVADCVQSNFDRIEINHLVPDMLHFFGTIEVLLEFSVRAFIQQSNSATASRRKGTKKIVRNVR
jgi:ActR/RegA family two-component response regulator